MTLLRNAGGQGPLLSLQCLQSTAGRKARRHAGRPLLLTHREGAGAVHRGAEAQRRLRRRAAHVLLLLLLLLLRGSAGVGVGGGGRLCVPLALLLQVLWAGFQAVPQVVVEEGVHQAPVEVGLDARKDEWEVQRRGARRHASKAPQGAGRGEARARAGRGFHRGHRT